MINEHTGVLLTNVGTPEAPQPQAVRQFLKEFLSDPRVIECPALLWKPILYGLILPFRPWQSAKLYQKIWMKEGAPLAVYSELLAQKLQDRLNVPVAIGMHYGRPTIEDALKKLLENTIKRIVVLPLFPQYSATTSASSFDKIAAACKKIRYLPEIRWLNHYAENLHYITTLADHIKHTWEQKGMPEHLLFSFHGIPERYARAGDIYPQLCHRSAEQIAAQLNLSTAQWSLAFQSRLGRLKWTTPYTDVVLKNLPKQGITRLHVVCPGFAVDCLETLEEIAIRGKEQFLEAGGRSFFYVPALNDSTKQIDFIEKIIQSHKT